MQIVDYVVNHTGWRWLIVNLGPNLVQGAILTFCVAKFDWTVEAARAADRMVALNVNTCGRRRRLDACDVLSARIEGPSLFFYIWHIAKMFCFPPKAAKWFWKRLCHDQSTQMKQLMDAGKRSRAWGVGKPCVRGKHCVNQQRHERLVGTVALSHTCRSLKDFVASFSQTRHMILSGNFVTSELRHFTNRGT
jgi:hypothetical protein